jgi:heat shock protein HslJ
MKAYLFTVLVACSSLLWACAGTQRTGSSTVTENKVKLEGTTWYLHHFQASDPILDTAGPQRAYIEFSDTSTHAYGSLGCNRFGAKYAYDSLGNLQFSQAYSTQMACSNMEIENHFSTVLQLTTKHIIVGNQLTFLKGDSALATFIHKN